MQLNPVRPDQLRSGAVSKAITRFISQGRRDFVPRGLKVVDRGGGLARPTGLVGVWGHNKHNWISEAINQNTKSIKEQEDADIRPEGSFPMSKTVGQSRKHLEPTTNNKYYECLVSIKDNR